MTRHAKNCTAGAFYTYSEKKKDASASGYGTSSQRLGKDSMNSFDCCALTLQPCQNPVITKDGYLFEKSAILEYIITKKREYARNLKEYNRCKESQVDSTLNSSNAIINKLDKISKSLIEATTLSNNSNNNDNNSISNMANGMDKKLPSFWVPSETPNNKLTLPKAPNSNIYCPVSNKPLRVKDLIDVKFTLVNEKDKNSTSLILSQSRYKCPITHDILSNSVACAVLKPTGDVVSMNCVNNVIRKDMIHPLTNQKLKESDIIPLQRGGTGFSSTNAYLEGFDKRPMLQA